MTRVVTRFLIHPKYFYNWKDRRFHRDPRDLDRCTKSKGGTAFQPHFIIVWLSSEPEELESGPLSLCREGPVSETSVLPLSRRRHFMLMLLRYVYNLIADVTCN